MQVRPGVGWAIAVGVVAVLVVGWVGRSPTPEASPAPKAKLTPADLSRMPVGRHEVDVSKLVHIDLPNPALGAATVDEMLARNQAAIMGCVAAASVHDDVADPLALVLTIEPHPRLRSRTVTRVTTGTTDLLDRCLSGALRKERFSGTEAVEVRAAWTAP
ncbi:MAG: hypothetical protein AAF602_14290 [Myxococcota bacterium]